MAYPGAAGRPDLFVYAALRHLAQRARCAAAILRRAAALIRRFGLITCTLPLRLPSMPSRAATAARSFRISAFSSLINGLVFIIPPRLDWAQCQYKQKKSRETKLLSSASRHVRSRPEGTRTLRRVRVCYLRRSETAGCSAQSLCHLHRFFKRLISSELLVSLPR